MLHFSFHVLGFHDSLSILAVPLLGNLKYQPALASATYEWRDGRTVRHVTSIFVHAAVHLYHLPVWPMYTSLNVSGISCITPVMHQLPFLGHFQCNKCLKAFFHFVVSTFDCWHALGTIYAVTLMGILCNFQSSLMTDLWFIWYLAECVHWNRLPDVWL